MERRRVRKTYEFVGWYCPCAGEYMQLTRPSSGVGVRNTTCMHCGAEYAGEWRSGDVQVWELTNRKVALDTPQNM